MVFNNRRFKCTKFRCVFMILPLCVVGSYILLAFMGATVQMVRTAWFDVDDDNHAYVFSAYYDERSPTVVTIFGVVTGNSTFFCQLGYSSPITTMEEVDATVHAYIHDHKKRYKNCNFKCSLPNNDIPKTVSLVTQRGQSPRHQLPVTEIKHVPYERNFTVCLKPINGRYGRAYELVQWIEMHRLLGAEKFIIYYYSSEANVVKVLDYYSKQGLVEVVQWPLPTIKVWDSATILSVNDCLFRVREKSRFLVFSDLDEFIIPHSKKSMNWHDMLEQLPDEGAFLFKNVFYRKEENDTKIPYSGKHIAEQFGIFTLLKTKREERVWEPIVRSKYIARTDAVDDLDNHHIENMTSGFRSIIVPTQIAYLHHYRSWEGCTLKEPMFKDITVISKYKQHLIDNVKTVWSMLPNVELVIPIP